MFYQKQLGKTSVFAFQELERIPGFVHLFTARGADSRMKGNQELGEVISEKQTLLQSLGIESDWLVFLNQVHSARVVTLNAVPGGSGPVEIGSADGIITVHCNQFPVIRTADCIPVLIILPSQRQVCALHAGWRGTRDRIAEKGVRLFLELTGTSSGQLVAALGPGIRECCYQVGPEVKDQYEKGGHDLECLFKGDHLDLVKANVVQLRELGVSRIMDSGICTACRTDLFYSYRREGATGRMWTLLGFRE
jgi:polyphenol oxidase